MRVSVNLRIKAFAFLGADLSGVVQKFQIPIIIQSTIIQAMAPPVFLPQKSQGADRVAQSWCLYHNTANLTISTVPQNSLLIVPSLL